MIANTFRIYCEAHLHAAEPSRYYATEKFWNKSSIFSRVLGNNPSNKPFSYGGVIIEIAKMSTGVFKLQHALGRNNSSIIE